jgi:hypothetical protein
LLSWLLLLFFRFFFLSLLCSVAYHLFKSFCLKL